MRVIPTGNDYLQKPGIKVSWGSPYFAQREDYRTKSKPNLLRGIEFCDRCQMEEITISRYYPAAG